MLPRDIRRIIRENKEHLDLFERYDETRVFDLDRIRRSFTLRRDVYRKLKDLSESTGKPMGRILDDLLCPIRCPALRDTYRGSA